MPPLLLTAALAPALDPGPAATIATAPAILPTFWTFSWLPSPDRLWVGLGVTVILFIIAVAAFYPLHRLIRRFGLALTYLVLCVSSGLYFGLISAGWNPAITHWIDRLYAAMLVFVFLRLLDRLLIVPLLTRGGTHKIPRFMHQLIFITLFLLALLIFGKEAFGWPIDEVLTAGGVLSIVLGLALQESLGNLFSGLMMQASPPFAIGDFITTGDVEGRVSDMTWRAVTILTIDDNYVIVPNGNIARQDIINYHAPTTATARMIKIGLDYDLPPCDAIAVLTAAARETDGVLSTPAPVAILLDFADSAILYGLRFWTAEPQRHLRIDHEVRLHMWYRLAEHGFNIPFPIRTVEHVSLPAKQRRAAQAAILQREAALRRVALLAPLTDAQHKQLAAGATDLRLAPRQILFRQNDPGDSLYVIRHGSAEVVVEKDGDTSVLATLQPGDFFGEMSALTGQPRSATIRAGSPLTLVQIGKADLQQVIDADPAILEKLSVLITQRQAERAALRGARDIPNAQALQAEQRTLLSRMSGFFRKKSVPPPRSDDEAPGAEFAD